MDKGFGERGVASISSSTNGVSGQFPAGLRVLVVDDDITCLKVLERMLHVCLYEGIILNLCFNFVWSF